MNYCCMGCWLLQHFCCCGNEYRFNFSAGLFVQMMSLRGAHVSIQADGLAHEAPKSKPLLDLRLGRLSC